MFFRLLLESFRRQRRRKTLAGLAILLGTTAVTAMLALATTIGDRIHSELAVYGANIVVTPRAADLDVNIGGQEIHPATGDAYLHESELDKLHTIFWANNITGVSPELTHPLAITVPLVQPGAASSVPAQRSVSAEGLWFAHDWRATKTGAPALHPWWKLEGAWPASPNDVVVGSALAAELHLRPGDMLALPAPSAQAAGSPAQAHVSGIVRTGGPEDDMLLMPLEALQSAAALPGAISRVEISARTKPEDAFARRNPDTLSPSLRDRWYCSPYANSIAYQIREAMPDADAQQVRVIEQSEGTVLSRISGLMWLVAAAAFLAAAFAVSAAMATAILERRAEIGLMRSLGAPRTSIALLFYAETGLLALLAGTGGYVLGSVLAAALGAAIFPSSGFPSSGPSAGILHAILSGFNPVLLPIVLGLALLIAAAGSTPSIRTALRLDPAATLRSDA